MQQRDRIIVIDFGTSAIKAGVVDTSGAMLGIGTVDYSLTTPQADWVECEAETYWVAAKAAIEMAQFQATSEHGEAPLAALTITGQGETFFCLDENREPLRPAIVWLDNRATEEAEELSALFTAQEIYEHTGQIGAFATWPAAKILWLRRHEPEVVHKTRWIVLLEDWFVAKISGQIVGDTSIWSSSIMLNIDDGTWWPEMLDALRISPDQLPAIHVPGEVVGRIGTAAAAELGITAGAPIVAGSIDLLVAAVGANNIAPGTVCEITGTVLGVITCVTERPFDISARLPVYRHIVPGQWCLAPYSQTAGLVLRWLRDNFYGPPGQLSREIQFDNVVAEAAPVPAGANGVMFLPHLAGAWFPEYDLSAKAAIVGLTLATGRGSVVRAALEAVGYMLRTHVENFGKVGFQPENIVSLGPSAQSLVWRQIKADITQLPVDRVVGAESTIIGAAVMAAVGIGAFPDYQSAVNQMVHPLDRTSPDSKVAGVYDRHYADYLQLFDVLAPTFHYDEAEQE